MNEKPIMGKPYWQMHFAKPLTPAEKVYAAHINRIVFAGRVSDDELQTRYERLKKWLTLNTRR